MRLRPRVLLSAVLAGLGGLASAAGTVPLSGALSATDPTFNRPVADVPPNILSGVGTAVSYDLYPFYVTAADSYVLRTLSASFTTGLADDTFIVLYANAFNPATPLANALSAADQGGATGPTNANLSLLSFALTPGQQYFFLVTSYANAQFGNYTASISNTGLGTAVLGAVPEPSTAWLMFGGLAVAGGLAARRRASA